MEKKFAKPWQAMPARVIELGIKHCKGQSDFDHQVGFLLLDIGVEAALKIFLATNKNEDLEFIRFPELLKKVQAEMDSQGISDIDLEEVRYFHGVRNKLYHQGDGVKPTGENLQRYASLAKKIAEKLLGVNIEEIQQSDKGREEIQQSKKNIDEYFITDKRRKQQRSIQQVSDELGERLKCFHETSLFITELVKPKLATRYIAYQIEEIRKRFVDQEEYIHDEARISSVQRANIILSFAEERLDLFNKLKLFEKQLDNQELVDFFLMDTNHLYVMIALRKISEEINDDWEKYVNYVDLLAELPSKWEYGMKYSRMDKEIIYEEYDQKRLWIETNQDKMDKWLLESLPDGILPSNNYFFISETY